jgi:hypothetical protein
MVKDADPHELRRKIAQTRRLASAVTDRTTQRRLADLQDELTEKLRRFPRRGASIPESRIRARAHELWEQHGRPEGRDEEFWLRAERELIGCSGDRDAYACGWSDRRPGIRLLLLQDAGVGIAEAVYRAVRRWGIHSGGRRRSSAWVGLIRAQVISRRAVVQSIGCIGARRAARAADRAAV